MRFFFLYIPLRNYRIDEKEYTTIMRDFCCLINFWGKQSGEIKDIDE